LAGQHEISKLYIPVSPPAEKSLNTPPNDTKARLKEAINNNGDEYMQVDDTASRIYIHDLDAELADIESDTGERLVFLPDIEKKLSKIPEHLLRGEGRSIEDSKHHELVLYSVPSSLTVSEENDSVRKAILEARKRAQDKALQDAEAAAAARNPHTSSQAETAHGLSAQDYVSEADEQDPDAMDIG